MATSKGKFEKLINDIAENLEWEVAWEDDMASVDFEAESGNNLTLYISNDEGAIQFDVASDAGFASEDDIPHEVSTQLLKRNLLLDIGAWVVEAWGDEWYYSVVYSTNIEALEPMEYEEIQGIVDALIEECDEFNEICAEENE